MAAVLGLAFAAFVTACGGAAMPHPRYVQVLTEDYVPVPYAPRPPPVEIVPARPAAPPRLVWVDGGWSWTGDRYRWSPGAWVAPPEGAKYAPWVIVRRSPDGQLFFAPSSWRDASDKPMIAPTPLARAINRPGGPASGELAPPGAIRTNLDE